MTRHEMRSTASKEQDKYESIVLEFLNKEMAAVQPKPKREEHTDDLDAVVSDLLKQVLNESNQSQGSSPAITDDREAMLAEFPPAEVKTAPDGSKAAESNNASLKFESLPSNDYPFSLIEFPPTDVSAEPENTALESDNASWQFMDAFPEIVKSASEFSDPQLEFADEAADLESQSLESLRKALKSDHRPLQSAGTPVDRKNNASAPQASPGNTQSEEYREAAMEVSESQPSTIGAKPLFGSAANIKSKKPIIALAAACLFSIIGYSAYHFLKAPKIESTISETPVLSQEVITPVSPAESIPKIVEPIQQTSNKQASARSEKTEKADPITIKTKPVIPVPNETLSVPEPPKNERPDLIQRTLQIAATTPGTVIDKLVPSAMPDKAALNAPRPPKPASKASPNPPVSGVLIPAVPTSQVSPKYPKLAVKTRASATVVLDLVIDEKGTVIDATPVSGPTLFHQEAVDAALQWKYQPASLGGVKVRSQSRITMNFKLK